MHVDRRKRRFKKWFINDTSPLEGTDDISPCPPLNDLTPACFCVFPEGVVVLTNEEVLECMKKRIEKWLEKANRGELDRISTVLIKAMAEEMLND